MNRFERLQAVALLGRRATLDPGAFTPRGADNDGNAYGESLERWQLRAVDAAVRQLLEAPSEVVKLTGHRDGKTYDPDLDFDRLNRQMKAVWGNFRDGTWWTLRQLSFRTGMPEASVSARLRDLRKPKFGAQEVEKRRASNGLWQYRLVRKES